MIIILLFWYFYSEKAILLLVKVYDWEDNQKDGVVAKGGDNG